MSFNIGGIFLGFTLILSSSMTIPLSLLVIKETKKEDYSAIMSFLGFGSFSVFFFSIFYSLSELFGLKTALGIDTSLAISIFALLLVFSILGTSWQIYEYTREEL